MQENLQGQNIDEWAYPNQFEGKMLASELHVAIAITDSKMKLSNWQIATKLSLI